MSLSTSSAETRWIGVGGVVEPWLRVACESRPTEITPEFLLDGARQSRIQIWAVYSRANPVPIYGAGAGCINNTTATAEILLLAGRDLTFWLDDALTEFENLAFEHDVKAIRFWGRTGWERMLPDYTIIEENGERILMEKVLI